MWSVHYDTDDHWIPMGWFVALYTELWRVLALDQLMAARGSRLGVTPALVGTDPGTIMEVEGLLDEAIPRLIPKRELPAIIIRAKAKDDRPT